MIQTFSKLEVARIQLDRALDLFLNSTDYISAIALAGASEEILGDLATRSKLPNAIDSTVAAGGGRNLSGDPLKKGIIGRANLFRNGLKYLDSGASLNLDPAAEAKELLDRAVSNYFTVTHEETPAMVRFKEQHLKPSS